MSDLNQNLLVEGAIKTYRLVVGRMDNIFDTYKEMLEWISNTRTDEQVIVKLDSYYGENSRAGFLPIARGIISQLKSIFDIDSIKYLTNLSGLNISNNEIIDILREIALEIDPTKQVIIILPLLDNYQFQEGSYSNQIYWFVDLANLVNIPIILKGEVILPLEKWKFIIPLSFELNCLVQEIQPFIQRYKEIKFKSDDI